MVSNYQRDGIMQSENNGGSNANYFPNSFDEIIPDISYKELPVELDSDFADWFDRNEEDNDHYTQPGNLYRHVLNAQDKLNLVSNIVVSMNGISGPLKTDIINRQLCHFFRADAQLGKDIASGLGMNTDAPVKSLISNLPANG